MANQNRLKYLGGAFFAALVIGVYLLSIYYAKIFANNVELKGKKQISFYVPSTADLHDFKNLVNKRGFLLNEKSFWWVAKKKKFEKIHPGHYQIKAGMSNNELVNIFRSGLQTPVKLLIPSVRTKSQLAGRLSKQVEADSLSIIRLLNDEGYLKKHGFTDETSVSVFIPDTYEIYWNLDAENLFLKMKKKYNAFWSKNRIKKAKKLGLSKTQVATLASIVQSEQSRFNDEKPIIAGLYLNRLRKGIRLESDPTLIFALGNFNIQRVLNKDKKIDSPYNTYKNRGLPPGPILVPHKSSLDAVLDYKKSDYLYMCAKEDFSGRHNFAKTYNQHLKYARKYRRALNKRGIKR